MQKYTLYEWVYSRALSSVSVFVHKHHTLHSIVNNPSWSYHSERIPLCAWNFFFNDMHNALQLHNSCHNSCFTEIGWYDVSGELECKTKDCIVLFLSYLAWLDTFYHSKTEAHHDFDKGILFAVLEQDKSGPKLFMARIFLFFLSCSLSVFDASFFNQIALCVCFVSSGRSSSLRITVASSIFSKK